MPLPEPWLADKSVLRMVPCATMLSFRAKNYMPPSVQLSAALILHIQIDAIEQDWLIEQLRMRILVLHAIANAMRGS